MLANYASGDFGLRLASMTEEDHVALILENIEEIHGNIAREQYTGNYYRKCWILDEFESGSWAEPSQGQHKLFMPSYSNIEHNTIFVGK
jgi:monoamine oxidase